jgi:protocatechuate 3,4-dioxygenase, alpha subunit
MNASSNPFRQTPSQTVGPYFAYGLTPEQYLYDFKSLGNNELISPLDPHAILLTGKVYDGHNVVIPDALLEIWQQDARGQHWGRFGTGTLSENRFSFYIHAPQVIYDHAPFLSVILFMRGQLIHSYTRIYFEDFNTWNQLDTEYISAGPRQSTLLAKKTETGYEFNIHMQGENETVFFDV